MKPLPFAIQDRMKILGWYQVVGAIAGLYFISRNLIGAGTLTGAYLFLIIIWVALFAFSFYCGYLLINANLKGLQLSTWNQALQVLQFEFGIIGFKYCSGITFAIGFIWGDKIKSDFSIGLMGVYTRFGESVSTLSILINFIPLAIIYWLLKIEKDIEARDKLMKAAANTHQAEIKSDN